MTSQATHKPVSIRITDYEVVRSVSAERDVTISDLMSAIVAEALRSGKIYTVETPNAKRHARPVTWQRCGELCYENARAGYQLKRSRKAQAVDKYEGHGWFLSGPGLDRPVLTGVTARDAKIEAEAIIQRLAAEREQVNREAVDAVLQEPISDSAYPPQADMYP